MRIPSVITESVASNGYIRVNLNQKPYDKHRIIALQFIPNDDPEHKTVVDHRNTIRCDNRIENLRWVTYSENSRNISGQNGVIYEYVDEIADDCIVIDSYGRRRLNGYYYDINLDQYYVKIDKRYRILHITTEKNGKKYINAHDVNDEKFKIYIKTFQTRFKNA